MSVSIRPDPNNQFIVINVDGKLVKVLNLQQDVEFTVKAVNGRTIRSGSSMDGLKKALGELRVIEDQKALESLAEQIELWLQAGQATTHAARYREPDLEIADLVEVVDLDLADVLLPDEDELDWFSPDQAKVSVGLPSP